MFGGGGEGGACQWSRASWPLPWPASDAGSLDAFSDSFCFFPLLLTEAMLVIFFFIDVALEWLEKGKAHRSERADQRTVNGRTDTPHDMAHDRPPRPRHETWDKRLFMGPLEQCDRDTASGVGMLECGPGYRAVPNMQWG